MADERKIKCDPAEQLSYWPPDARAQTIPAPATGIPSHTAGSAAEKPGQEDKLIREATDAILAEAQPPYF